MELKGEKKPLPTLYWRHFSIFTFSYFAFYHFNSGTTSRHIFFFFLFFIFLRFSTSGDIRNEQGKGRHKDHFVHEGWRVYSRSCRTQVGVKGPGSKQQDTILPSGSSGNQTVRSSYVVVARSRARSKETVDRDIRNFRRCLPASNCCRIVIVQELSAGEPRPRNRLVCHRTGQCSSQSCLPQPNLTLPFRFVLTKLDIS